MIIYPVTGESLAFPLDYSGRRFLFFFCFCLPFCRLLCSCFCLPIGSSPVRLAAALLGLWNVFVLFFFPFFFYLLSLVPDLSDGKCRPLLLRDGLANLSRSI